MSGGLKGELNKMVSDGEITFNPTQEFWFNKMYYDSNNDRGNQNYNESNYNLTLYNNIVDLENNKTTKEKKEEEEASEERRKIARAAEERKQQQQFNRDHKNSLLEEKKKMRDDESKMRKFLKETGPMNLARAIVYGFIPDTEPYYVDMNKTAAMKAVGINTDVLFEYLRYFNKTDNRSFNYVPDNISILKDVGPGLKQEAEEMGWNERSGWINVTQPNYESFSNKHNQFSEYMNLMAYEEGVANREKNIKEVKEKIENDRKEKEINREIMKTRSQKDWKTMISKENLKDEDKNFIKAFANDFVSLLPDKNPQQKNVFISNLKKVTIHGTKINSIIENRVKDIEIKNEDPCNKYINCLMFNFLIEKNPDIYLNYNMSAFNNKLLGSDDMNAAIQTNFNNLPGYDIYTNIEISDYFFLQYLKCVKYIIFLWNNENNKMEPYKKNTKQTICMHYFKKIIVNTLKQISPKKTFECELFTDNDDASNEDVNNSVEESGPETDPDSGPASGAASGAETDTESGYIELADNTLHQKGGRRHKKKTRRKNSKNKINKINKSTRKHRSTRKYNKRKTIKSIKRKSINRKSKKQKF